MIRFSRLVIAVGFGLSQVPTAEAMPADRERFHMSAPTWEGSPLDSREAAPVPAIRSSTARKRPAHPHRRLGSTGPAIDLAHTWWARVASARSLDPYLLYAVALIESARISDGLAAPWPWALNHSGLTFYPENPEAALAQVRKRLAAGKKVIDIGLMQVNLRWHGRRVETLEALLDPVTNVRLGADILAEAIASAPGDLALGVGRYHTWRNPDAAYRYGRRALALAERLRSPEIW